MKSSLILLLLLPALCLGANDITSWTDLAAIDANAATLDANYVLTVDLDKDSPEYNTYASPTANDGNGFDPIGDGGAKFTGTFNGQGHTISDLYINRITEDNIGLFGYINDGAEISKVGLIDCNFSGHNSVGGLCGTPFSSNINNSYATGTVSGNDDVGGLFGVIILSSMSNCYSTCSVSGNTSQVGGLIGYESGSTVSNSFWDTETSGQATSDGGTGKTTKEMQDPYTFYDWNFNDVWYWNDPMGNRARLTAPFSNKMRGRRRGGQGGYMKLRE